VWGVDSRVMERLVVGIDRSVHGGRSLAIAPDGRVVLVAGAIPGERVRVRAATRRGVLMGEVEEVLEPSPDRVEVPPHPGLDLGHVAYERQLSIKAAVIHDAWLRAHGRDAPPLELSGVVPSPQRWGYRGSIQPAVAERRRDGTELGYRRPESHEVVTLEADPTAMPACAEGWRILRAHRLAKGVREIVLRGDDEGGILAALVATSAARDLLPLAHDLVRAGFHGVAGAPFDPRGRFRAGATRLAGGRTLRQPFGDVIMTVTATSFAQPNPHAAALLYRDLAEWAPEARHAVDLFAGSGVIAAHLARRAQRVTALEIDRGSVERGRRDLAAAGLTNVDLRREDVRTSRLPDDVDLVAVDPPRSGLSGTTRDALVASGAEGLLYVSCDVATWARDVADLARRGWRLERVRAYDFQPHTHHVELLSSLRRG
jgi:23S rRNA (uracil1939-C5)-methyltransferase